MTTRLERPVTRLVRDGLGRELVVTLARRGIEFRLPGERRSRAMLLPYQTAFVRAGYLAGDAQLLAKRLAKAERRQRLAEEAKRWRPAVAPAIAEGGQ